MENENIKPDLEMQDLIKYLRSAEHDLKTPLSIIIGYSEMMQEKIGKTGLEDCRDYVTKILNSAKHLMVLMDGVFDLSKIEKQ